MEAIKFFGILLGYFAIVPFLIIFLGWLFETFFPVKDVPYTMIISKSPLIGLEYLFSSGVSFTQYFGTDLFAKAPLFSIFFVGGIALAIGYLATELKKSGKKIFLKALCFVPFFVLLFFLILSQNYFSLSEQALKAENTSPCEIGFEKSIRNGNCGEYFGCGFEYKRNSQYCEEIYYATMAKKNSDVSYCEKIDYINSRLGCIYEVALETKNPEICQKIAANPSDEFYSNTLGSLISTKDCLVKIASKTQGAVNGCIDSDMGDQPYEKGTAYHILAPTETSTDTCFELLTSETPESCNGKNCVVKEYYCNEGGPYLWYDNCPNGCANGTCIK